MRDQVPSERPRATAGSAHSKSSHAFLEDPCTKVTGRPGEEVRHICQATWGCLQNFLTFLRSSPLEGWAPLADVQIPGGRNISSAHFSGYYPWVGGGRILALSVNISKAHLGGAGIQWAGNKKNRIAGVCFGGHGALSTRFWALGVWNLPGVPVKAALRGQDWGAAQD